MTSKPASLHVDKPWGSFDQFVLNTPCTVKILTCNPGQKLSLQRHRQRNELWVALDAGVVWNWTARSSPPTRAPRSGFRWAAPIV